MIDKDIRKLQDIADTIKAIRRYSEMAGLDPDVLFDALRMRIIEIGEAVNSISSDTLVAEPDIPWRQIVQMRNWLSHRYWDSQRGQVQQVLDEDLDPLLDAVNRLLQSANNGSDEADPDAESNADLKDVETEDDPDGAEPATDTSV
jgi:uncharacterized protein with HEPN domain